MPVTVLFATHFIHAMRAFTPCSHRASPHFGWY